MKSAAARVVTAPLVRSLGLAMLLVGLAVPPVLAQQAETDETMEQGRTATGWFYDGELEKVLELGLTDQMREAIPDLEAWQRVHDQVMGQLGDEIEVVDENVTRAQGFDVYLRTVHFAQTGNRPILVQWAFDDQGRVAGFYVRPQQQ